MSVRLIKESSKPVNEDYESSEEQFDFLDSWYGRRNELEDDLEENGYDVLESNDEYITVSDPDDGDIQYVLYLGGTRTTITIEKIKTIYI